MKGREYLKESEKRAKKNTSSAFRRWKKKSKLRLAFSQTFGLPLPLPFLSSSPPSLPLFLSSTSSDNDAVQDHDDAHALRCRRAQGEYLGLRKVSGGTDSSKKDDRERCLRRRFAFDVFSLSPPFRRMLSSLGLVLLALAFQRCKMNKMQALMRPEVEKNAPILPCELGRFSLISYLLLLTWKNKTNSLHPPNRPSLLLAAPSSPSAPRPSTPARTRRSRR